MAIVEAASAGLLVVATAVGGVPEVREGMFGLQCPWHIPLLCSVTAFGEDRQEWHWVIDIPIVPTILNVDFPKNIFQVSRVQVLYLGLYRCYQHKLLC
jgi:hypothetical protein